MLRAVGGAVGGDEMCAPVPAGDEALAQLLNESQALLAPLLPAPARARVGAAQAEDAVEQRLYEAQNVTAPRRRAAELLPRTYGFVGDVGGAVPPPADTLPPPLPRTSPLELPAAAVAQRSVFGWPASWQASALVGVCIAVLLLLGACAGFTAGVRKVRRCGSCVREDVLMHALRGAQASVRPSCDDDDDDDAERDGTHSAEPHSWQAAEPPRWQVYDNRAARYTGSSYTGSSSDDSYA